MSDGQKAGALRWAMWRHQSRASCAWLVLVLCVHTKVLGCTLGLSCYVSIHRVQMHRGKVEGRVNGFIVRWWWRLEGKHDTQLVLEQVSNIWPVLSQWQLIFPHCNDCLIFIFIRVSLAKTLTGLPDMVKGSNFEWVSGGGTNAGGLGGGGVITNLGETSMAYVTSQRADF